MFKENIIKKEIITHAYFKGNPVGLRNIAKSTHKTFTINHC